jgi:hypothetical protein
MDTLRFFQLLFLACFTSVVMACNDDFISAVGDPGMRRDGLRVAIEAWNQCNEVGEEAVNMGSPRMADCFDVDHSTSSGEKCLVPLHLCAVTYYEYNFARKEREQGVARNFFCPELLNKYINIF